jgi:rhamnogalacturonyl hydrolase YesR
VELVSTPGFRLRLRVFAGARSRRLQGAKNMSRLIPSFLVLAILGSTVPLAIGQKPTADDYLRRVRAYADFMLDQGRDRYGKEQSPLFAECLDRHTGRMLEGAALDKVAAIPFATWGVRSHDRMLTAANPMHCEALYLVLYALTDATGQARYATEADRSLKYFLTHCQSPATGLFYWGEHAGWDLNRDAPMEGRAANTHEFFRPWELWDRCYALDREACVRFARGLWEHQIGDHRTGDYSRHAAIDKHGPGTEAPYARHGGFYLTTWAKAYQKTGDKLFLQAIETVVDLQERARVAEGMLVGGSKKKGGRTKQDLSLAVSLWEAAQNVPDPLAGKLRQASAANDDPAARIKLTAWAADKPSAENLWSSGYGNSGGEIAGPACLRMIRWRQTRSPVYERAVMKTADRYLGQAIDRSYPVHPCTVGKVLLVMLYAHELTADQRYRDGADRLAAEAIGLFLTGGSPLPKASHVHDHYEAVTGADALMMALLELWARHQQPPRRLNLPYVDR